MGPNPRKWAVQMPEKKVRYAVVGLGHIAQAAVPGCQHVTHKVTARPGDDHSGAPARWKHYRASRSSSVNEEGVKEMDSGNERRVEGGVPLCVRIMTASREDLPMTALYPPPSAKRNARGVGPAQRGTERRG